jgi:hypothetical protein
MVCGQHPDPVASRDLDDRAGVCLLEDPAVEHLSGPAERHLAPVQA